MAPRPSGTRVALALRVGIVIGVAASWGGCGGAVPPAPDVPASFPAMVLATADSTSGHLHIALRAAPAPLVRGQNVGQLAITDDAGQPVDGLSLALIPWMPSHGHGTSVQPEITPSEVGVFIANPLYLFMAGEWELRMTFEGVFNDTATATVAIP
jgi:hypothetical protein